MRNPQPTQKAACSNHLVALRAGIPASTDRVKAYAAATQINVRAASGLFTRSIATVIGVSANVAAAISATFSPAQRRTVRCNRNTVATPSTACGSASAQACQPKIHTDTTWGHRPIGGLSTVTTPAGS